MLLIGWFPNYADVTSRALQFNLVASIQFRSSTADDLGQSAEETDMFIDPQEAPQIVTRSDKRGTKSLGRSRDNWRKLHLGVILSIYSFFYSFTFMVSILSGFF